MGEPQLRVQRGILEAPYRLLLVGPDGIGKTTLASHAPNPLFFDPTGGTNQLDVARIKGESWKYLLGLIEELSSFPYTGPLLEGEKTQFKTLVIDELGAVEQLCWDYLNKLHNKPGIAAWGYAKGFAAAIDEWRRVLTSLTAMNLNVILIGHQRQVQFKNPEGLDYLRYSLDLYDGKSSSLVGLIYHWVDAYLFCKFKTYAEKNEDGKVIGQSDGSRIICTNYSAAFDAKNRYNLPPELPMNWDELSSAMKGRDPTELVTEIEALLPELPDAIRKKVSAFTKKHQNDSRKLVQILDRARGKIT